MEVSLIDNIGSPHDNIDPRVRCQHLLPHARISKPEVVAGPGEDQPRVPGARARQVPGRCGLPLRVCDRAAAGDQGRVQEVREGPGPEGGIRRVRVSQRRGRVCLHQVRRVCHCLTHQAYIMFYRDDRMVETEHLGLCEVIVTPTPGETGDTLHILLFILSLSPSNRFYPLNIEQKDNPWFLEFYSVVLSLQSPTHAVCRRGQSGGVLLLSSQESCISFIITMTKFCVIDQTRRKHMNILNEIWN